MRASGGARADGRRVARVVATICVLVLTVVAIATTIGAADQNSLQTRLQRHGVPVEVTVTGCVGYGSGIGQAVTFYNCRGNYALDGHSYNEVIGGSRVALPVGQTLAAVAVPGDPALVSTAAAVAKKFSPWTPYITPIVLVAITVVLVAGLLLGPKWRRRTPLGHQSSLPS